MASDVASIHNLCFHLICAAFQRCRISENRCRLSVVLKPSHSHPRNFTISSVGSCLEEYQGLKNHSEDVSAGSWDGMLSIKTTGISDNEIYHYVFNLKESTSSRRLTKIPPVSKNGAKFSGTEASLSISGSINVLLENLDSLFRKMIILKIPDVAIELVAENGNDMESRYDKVFLANEFNPLPLKASHGERLKSGVEEYVLKHGNCKTEMCDRCFPTREYLKIGSGKDCTTGRARSSELVMDVVIIISQSSEPINTCFRARGAETEVLYFKDFSLSSTSQSYINTLASFDWKSYGLILESIKDVDGCAVLKWENLPENAHIDIGLHCYDKKALIPPARQKMQVCRTLMKNSLKHALDNLKNRHSGWLLSTRALTILNNAPDLAKTVAGLILSSNDSDFKEECFSLLGLPSQGVGSENIEHCIKEKIISVIEINDRKPKRSKEATPFLFEEDCVKDLEFQDEVDEENEDLVSLFD